MKERRITCPICGKEFVPKAANAKYCCIDCKVKGQRQRRKEWEKESGYLDKQRQKMRDYRDKIAAEERAAAAAAEERAAINKKRQETRRRNDRLATLLQAAEMGNHNARKALAIIESGNTSPEYWEAYKDAYLQWVEEHGTPGALTVNGISVYSQNFGLSVSISIEELGIVEIATTARKEKGNAESDL